MSIVQLIFTSRITLIYYCQLIRDFFPWPYVFRRLHGRSPHAPLSAPRHSNELIDRPRRQLFESRAREPRETPTGRRHERGGARTLLIYARVYVCRRVCTRDSRIDLMFFFSYRCMKAAVDMLLSMGWFHKSRPGPANAIPSTALPLAVLRAPLRHPVLSI